METYHLFTIHRNSLEPTFPSSQCFYGEGNERWAVVGGTSVGDFERDTWLGVLVWPTLLMVMQPPLRGSGARDSIVWTSTLSATAETCLVSAGITASYTERADPLISEQIFDEDRIQSENQQRGIRSHRNRPGPMLPLERNLVDFHHYLGSRLLTPAPS